MAWEAIIEKLATVQEARLWHLELTALQNSLYKTDPRAFDETIAGQVSAGHAKLLESELVGEKTERSKLLTELNDALFKLQVVKIEMAVDLPERSLDRIRDWVKKNFGKEVVLDVVVKSAILGGAIIEYQGRLFDGSLARQIDPFINGGAG